MLGGSSEVSARSYSAHTATTGWPLGKSAPSCWRSETLLTSTVSENSSDDHPKEHAFAGWMRSGNESGGGCSSPPPLAAVSAPAPPPPPGGVSRRPEDRARAAPPRGGRTAAPPAPS